MPLSIAASKEYFSRELFLDDVNTCLIFERSGIQLDLHDTTDYASHLLLHMFLICF